jgi:hypothetical protein
LAAFAVITEVEDWKFFISSILPGIDAELLHASKKSSAIQAHSLGGSISAANLSFAFGECAHDLVALLLGIIVNNTLFAS